MRNGEAVPLEDIPSRDIATFRAEILAAVGDGARIVALFGAVARPRGAGSAPGAGPVRLYAALAHADTGRLTVHATGAEGGFPSLTPECPQAHLFEREVFEQHGLRPEGHPWLKPVRARARAGPFFRVHGEDIHEVGVGPVHAGVIEPGHFRFQCYGERVLHLEIALGYQHRGVERAMVAGPGNDAPAAQPSKRSIHWAETLAGDTSVGHATAYCGVLEALGDAEPPLRAMAIRAIALELERLANHTGDLGALAGDVGFLPTASYCGRLRGDFLNLSAAICGSRFGRGLVRPGGVSFDIDPPRARLMLDRLEDARRDLALATSQLFASPSVLGRFEGTGDVYARAQVRGFEIRRSIDFVREQIESLPEGPAQAERSPGMALAPDSLALYLAEGWRGEVCHAAITDSRGNFAAYKVVDPSFHNWTGLAMALRNQQISDFPLCNKSFNLSYCGFDL